MANQTAKSDTIKSYCIMCAVRCPVECDVVDGKLVRVRPDLEHPLGGPFCPKGAAAPELVSDPARLKYPMKRTNPKTDDDPGWTRISWDEALDTISDRMLRTREIHGPEAVAFYRPAPGGSPARDFNPWMMRLAHAFGSPNLASTTHICNWHKDSGSAFTYGVGLPEADYDNAGCIVIWGTNPHATGVRHVAAIKKAVQRGAKLIVVDPVRIPLAKDAAHWLQVKPSADLPLALGLINQVIANNGYDEAFLTRWTNAPFLLRRDSQTLLTQADIDDAGSPAKYVVWDTGSDAPAIYDPETVGFGPKPINPALGGQWDITGCDGKPIPCVTVFGELARSVALWTPEETSRITGVPAANIIEAAGTIGSAHPVCYYSYNGIEQHTDAMQINRAICILYALTGDFDTKGGVVSFPGLPAKPAAGFDLLPKSGRDRIGFEKRPLGPSKEGHVQAYAMYDAITKGDPYPVKALICFGGNLIISNGDTRRGAEALRQLDFYVHMDCYENPTSRFADILLPAASLWESEALGLFNWRDTGHLQVRRAVVAPEYERRPDLDVIFQLAVKLGLGNTFYNGDLEAAFSDQLSPLNISFEELRNAPIGVPVPLDPSYQKYAQTDPSTGHPRGFKTPSRLMEIYSLTFAANGHPPLPVYGAPPEQQVDQSQFPLLLTASKPGAYTHGSYRSIPSLRRLVPEPGLEINPETAKARNVDDGEWIALATPRGSVKVRAAYREDVQPGTVIGQEGWWQACEAVDLPGYDPFSEEGANLNLLMTNALIDPITGSVPHRGQPCEVRKLA